jgi:hypothetical protein
MSHQRDAASGARKKDITLLDHFTLKRAKAPRSNASRIRKHSLPSLLREAVEKLLSTQIHLLIHKRSAGAEGIVEVIDGQRGILRIVF